MTPLFSYRHQGLIFETYSEKPEFKGLKLIEINQVHGSRIVHFSDAGCEADAFEFQAIQLDKMVPAIRTADCLPIWIQSNQTNYLIHAGWRGLNQNIFQSIPTIDFALIGPSIQSSSFEVKEDFRSYFPDSEFFHKTSEKLTFNLQACAKKLIREISPNINQIIDSEVCTFESNQFHSYRLNKTIKRNWSIIRSIS